MRRAKRNRIDPHPGGIERLKARTFSCEAQAKLSCSARVMPYRDATFSDVMPYVRRMRREM